MSRAALEWRCRLDRMVNAFGAWRNPYRAVLGRSGGAAEGRVGFGARGDRGLGAGSHSFWLHVDLDVLMVIYGSDPTRTGTSAARIVRSCPSSSWPDHPEAQVPVVLRRGAL